MPLTIIPDWDPTKQALNLRNQYDPILQYNAKIICDKCGTRHFPDEDTFIVIYGNITINFGRGVVGNNFRQDDELDGAAIFCRSKKCIESFTKSLLLPSEDEYEDEDVEDPYKDI
jgi:hypothetical protein